MTVRGQSAISIWRSGEVRPWASWVGTARAKEYAPQGSAGVTTPTKGKVEINGRIFPMIELNAGLHVELTGRENVRLLGAVMGLSRKEIETNLPAIEDFTELGGVV